MVAKVALVRTNQGVTVAYKNALRLLGGLQDLMVDRVTIKVGIFDKRNCNYPTVQVVQTVVDAFARSKQILVVESDNYSGKALERLAIWHSVFSERVVPFSLSDDEHTERRIVCGEPIEFAHVLFKPYVRVSLHVLRKNTAGVIFKNLLGLIPDIRKDRFHKKLGTALIDIAQAVGWIDLAVIDATYMYRGAWKEGVPLDKEERNLLVVGRDPVAVETIGCLIASQDPLTIPALVVAKERSLGETNVDYIEIVGESIPAIVNDICE
jgi:uncharacterized protein (DUF362 family)